MDLCARNETSVSAECAQTDALQIGFGNGSLGTSNISHDGNVSTALTPQRMREKGEWTRVQLEPTATLQTSPKTHIFVFKSRKRKNSHPQTRGKEQQILDTNPSTMRAERSRRCTEMSVGIWAFTLLTESGIRGKVCHARIQILSIAWPRFPAVSLFNTSFYFWVCYQKYLCLTVKSSQATLRFWAIAEAKMTCRETKGVKRILSFLSASTRFFCFSQSPSPSFSGCLNFGVAVTDETDAVHR